ncbi:hypothetical protein EVAR_6394_1 [Eumeta japonica]|uniref:Uncharacterized protein n=1 Tax=Eumeta variegata TaxID=151549 RepID=A0A4C1TCI8_EUMVA|nr:hypothetical protein EVAR_6394_1 [Eumeta japonica]
MVRKQAVRAMVSTGEAGRAHGPEPRLQRKRAWATLVLHQIPSTANLAPTDSLSFLTGGFSLRGTERDSISDPCKGTVPSTYPFVPSVGLVIQSRPSTPSPSCSCPSTKTVLLRRSINSGSAVDSRVKVRVGGGERCDHRKETFQAISLTPAFTRKAKAGVNLNPPEILLT